MMFDNRTFDGAEIRGSRVRIQLSPGLVITVRPFTSILISMPDAATCAMLLAEASNTIAMRYGRDMEPFAMMPKTEEDRAQQQPPIETERETESLL